MRCRVLLLTLFALGVGAWAEGARADAGGGLLLDLPGCLVSAPCTQQTVAFSQLRLTLGDEGPVRVHLDVLHPLAASPAALWAPSVVLALPLPLATGELVLYLGVGPLLAASHAQGGAVDWLWKAGQRLALDGLAFYAELLFAMPPVSLPSVALGAAIAY